MPLQIKDAFTELEINAVLTNGSNNLKTYLK